MQQCPQCLRLKPEAAQLCDCGWAFEIDAPGEESPELAGLRQQIVSGANWFYWIAGLTIVNSVLSLFGVQVEFLLGMGLTRLVRAFSGGMFGVPMPNLSFEPGLLPALIVEAFIALGVAALGRMASRGSRSAYVIGIGLYAFDTLFFVFGQLIWSVLIHVVALGAMTRGFLALCSARRLAIGSFGNVATANARWPRYVWAGVGLTVFVPIVLVIAVGLFVDGEAIVREQILARAPEGFSEVDRERLQSAFDAVKTRLEVDGNMARQDAATLDRATMSIINKPVGELATVEEMRELTAILETVAASSVQQAAGVQRAPGAQRAVGVETSAESPSTSGAGVSTAAFRFRSPDGWSLVETEDGPEGSEVQVRLGEGAGAIITIRVDSGPESPRDRVATSSSRLGAAHRLSDCQEDWDYSDWGTHEGQGQVLTCRRGDVPISVKFFASKKADGRTLEVHEVFETEAETQVSVADYVIQESFELDSAG